MSPYKVMKDDHCSKERSNDVERGLGIVYRRQDPINSDGEFANSVGS